MRSCTTGTVRAWRLAPGGRDACRGAKAAQLIPPRDLRRNLVDRHEVICHFRQRLHDAVTLSQDQDARPGTPDTGTDTDADKAKLGRAKADETLCTMCHLGGFAGQNEIPRVAGQNYDYIVKQLADGAYIAQRVKP